MIYDCSSVQSCDSASCSYFHTLTFFQPPIFPKTLTNLTDLTDFTILQTPYRQCAGTCRTFVQLCGLHGAPVIFCAPCTGCCIAAFRRGWKTVRRAAKIVCFPSFLPEKLKFLGQKKSSEICSPTRSRGQISFMAWNRVKRQEEKWGAASPRSCVPLIPIPTKGHVSRLALLFLAVSSNVQQADGLPEVLHRRGQGFHSIVKRDDD